MSSSSNLDINQQTCGNKSDEKCKRSVLSDSKLNDNFDAQLKNKDSNSIKDVKPTHSRNNNEYFSLNKISESWHAI